MKLVRTEEALLAVEGLSLEYATVVADVVVILVKHVAGSHSVDALLAFLDRQCFMQVLIEDEDFVVLSHLLEAIAVELGGFREVAGFDGLVLKAVEL